jgi:hypothetical protein
MTFGAGVIYLLLAGCSNLSNFFLGSFQSYLFYKYLILSTGIENNWKYWT